MIDRVRAAAAARRAALACLLLVATQAYAQMHRCETNGRVTFSDRPCPGASLPAGPATAPAAAPRPAAAPPAVAPSMAVPVPPQPMPPVATPAVAAPTGDAALARRCAAGDAAACRTQQVLARHTREMDDLGRQCTGGHAPACDALACVKTNDRSACARAEGRSASPAPTATGAPSAMAGAPPSAAGWAETSRRVENRPGRRTDGSATGDRYTVVSIRCGDGGLGMVELGPGGARIGGQGVPYTSLDDAATRMCSRAR